MVKAPAGGSSGLSSSKKDAQQDKAVESLITVYIMGKAYEVPAKATIMGAIEYAGHQIIRGAGCREGYCGACATWPLVMLSSCRVNASSENGND